MRRAAGFTLLELLVVVTIMAAVYILVPRMFVNGVSGADLRATSRNLAAGLRQARSLALTERRETALTVDLEKRNFALSGNARVFQMPEKIEISLFTAQSEVAGDKQGSIRFFPDGSSTGGRVTVSSGEQKFLVDVDWLTGRVSIRS